MDLVVIGNVHTHPSCEAFLRKLLRCIGIHGHRLFLVSGDFPEEFVGAVTWFRITGASVAVDSLPKRLVISALNQLKVTGMMLSVAKRHKTRTVLFLSPVIMTMIITRILGMEVVLYQGGSIAMGDSIAKKILISLVAKTATTIAIESESCLKSQNLQPFALRTTVAPLYVDESIFRIEKNIASRKRRIGFIGVLDQNKGIERFCMSLIAMKEYLRTHNVEVVISGEGPRASAARNLVNLNNLSDRVTFTGWISHDRLSDTLNDLRLLVIPSASEGVPNILLEALATGTPVLAAPVGGIPDIVRDGNTGFIIRDTSPKLLAEDIIRALETPELELERIVVNAKDFVRREFSYEVSVLRWAKILGCG